MIIPLNLGADSYDIVLERGALEKASEYLDLNRRALIVTDSGVPKEYAEKVLSLCKSGSIFTVPRGEDSKNFDNFRKIMSKMLSLGFTRGDCVIAVGGGVVGDLAGFSAACYMRGVDFYNIPTTLLSQVDSSIGGKTAIDLDGVKNIVGAFYQPKCVLIDPDTLKTLDSRQLKSGLCEAIKMAAACDGELFELIEKSENLEADLPTIIERSLIIKRDVVEKDPKERGIRKVLNFGHTVGHAIEANRGGALLHGECVALGMIPMSGEGAKTRIINLLKKYDIPYEITDNPDDLLSFITHDKKMQSGAVSAVYCGDIGKFELRNMTPEEILGKLSR